MHEIRDMVHNFMNETSIELRQKGFELQEQLLERVNTSEAHVQDFEKRLTVNQREIRLMEERIEQEYKDFLQNRRKWKSEFAHAHDNSLSHLQRVN